MNCPYCISEIDDNAVVCSVCRRELYLIKPLLERVAVLEAEIAEQSCDINKVVPDDSSGKAVVAGLEAPVVEEERSITGAIGWWVLTLLFLVLGHWMLIFVYDAKVIYLRLFALIVPLPFGFLFARALRLSFAWGVLPAFLMAGLSVLGMGGVTSLIDHVPLLPRGMIELREYIEFSVSIGLSFSTGLWLFDWQVRHREAKRLMIAESRRGIDGSGGQRLVQRLVRLNDIGSAIVAILTTALAFYTGLKKLID